CSGFLPRSCWRPACCFSRDLKRGKGGRAGRLRCCAFQSQPSTRY
ncbi:MAG: hypothetical protein AVDCRST_MAG42-2455, partial [uncultured Chthoniobacterales bacterium]